MASSMLRSPPVWTQEGEDDGSLEDYLPQRGQIITWTGVPCLAHEFLHMARSPGILHPCRPRLPLFDETGERPLYDLLLIQRLKGGIDTEAQVWLCRAGEHMVVVKFAYTIFPVEEEYPYPWPTDFDSLTAYHLEMGSLWQETLAYNRLAWAQGSIVPHSYAIWKVS